MMKVTTTVLVDEDLKQRAKEAGLNISEELNRALKLKTNPSHQDVPASEIMFRCFACRNSVKECFLCRELSRVFCDVCNLEALKNCVWGQDGEHMHIRIPGFDGSNKQYADEARRVSND